MCQFFRQTRMGLSEHTIVNKYRNFVINTFVSYIMEVPYSLDSLFYDVSIIHVHRHLTSVIYTYVLHRLKVCTYVAFFYIIYNK